MSEYAVVKSFLCCLSSSFVFSSTPGKDRARLAAILENVRQAIDHQGLSASTQELLRHVFEHLKSFEAKDIDSTELDFLIDGALRDIGQAEDCGIRVFVERPSVSFRTCSCVLARTLCQTLFPHTYKLIVQSWSGLLH